MPLIILSWGAFYIAFGSVISVSEGLGYDGFYYADIVKNFRSLVFEGGLDSYRIQKILPSFVVSLSMKLLGVSISSLHIVKAFQIYNLSLLIICTFLWFRIARIYSFDLKMLWLGFIIWFLNFGIAELTFYYPVLTDTTAFCLGFFLLYAYLKNHLLLKIIITLLGSFAWATFIYLGLLLIIFPADFKFKLNFPVKNTFCLKKMFFAFLIPLPFLLIALYYFRKYINLSVMKLIDTEIIDLTLYVCAIINYFIISYFFVVCLPDNISFKNFLRSSKAILSAVKPAHVLTAVLLFSSITFVQNYLSVNNPEGNSLQLLMYYISIYGGTKPLVFAVTAVNYFGAVFIMYYFFLKNFSLQFRKLGTGVYIFFIVSFLLLFTTEARMIIDFFPFIVLAAILVLREMNISGSFFILMLISSGILSKIYVPMSLAQISETYKFEFPSQLYFMNTYMISIQSYVILGSTILVISLLLLNALRKDNPEKNISTQ